MGSIVGIPFLIAREFKYREYLRQKYWSIRRDQFNEEIESCKKQTDQNACYTLVTQLEETKNNNAIHDPYQSATVLKWHKERIKANPNIKSYP